MKTLSLKQRPWWRGTWVDNWAVTTTQHRRNRERRGMRLEFHAKPEGQVFVWACGEITAVLHSDEATITTA